MKKIVLIVLSIATFWGCKKQDRKTETSVIYEVHIRQYSPEGTLNAFTQDIPRLKELGVKIIWLMPVQPISLKNRKATGALSIEEVDEPNKEQKYKGSYYSITDYTAIHPEYGTMDDFKKLVATAHENGMYVLLDWVANHTGWDHQWISKHPEYYHKNEKGEVTDPLNPETGESWGWTDVAHLNYDNEGLFDAMAQEMVYWVKETNIDGFRCDVADNVKVSFWEYVYPKLTSIKPVFMLAESEKDFLLKSVFDMGYGWEVHHIMNEIAKGHKNVSDWDDYMKRKMERYQAEDIFMNFTSNHDENSWNGTVFERMGLAAETFAALTYMMPGMPLIYNGQEYNMNKRLKFFEKDTMPTTKGTMYPLYEKLGKIKNENHALNGGKNAGSYIRLNTSEAKRILAFARAKNGEEVLFVANLSAESTTFSMQISGKYADYMNNESVVLEETKMLDFSPWQYRILIKK